jgi:5-methylcytosine-specific restriction endonuclease McrA
MGKWGGCMNRKYQDYLISDVWKSLRSIVLERDGDKCVLCCSDKKLQIHHRQYPKTYGTESLSDLTTLCEECHNLFHQYRELAQKAVQKKIRIEANAEKKRLKRVFKYKKEKGIA